MKDYLDDKKHKEAVKEADERRREEQLIRLWIQEELEEEKLKKQKEA